MNPSYFQSGYTLLSSWVKVPDDPNSVIGSNFKPAKHCTDHPSTSYFSLNQRRSNLLCARHLIHFPHYLPSLSLHSETRYQNLPILPLRSQLIFRFHRRIAAVYSGATVARAGHVRYPLLVKYQQAPTSITVIGRTRTSGIGSDMERSGDSGLWEMPNELESVARTQRRG